jgi:hypothetical protein
MISLKFPKLDKALQKVVKDEPIDSPVRGILILDQKAIVFRHRFCLVVDLYDYFTLDCGIEDSEELEMLEGILLYMDRKIFNIEYWLELTKGANMQMSKGTLIVDTPRFSKDLHYKELDIDFTEPLQKLTIAKSYDESPVGAIAIDFLTLKTIIFQFNRQDSLVKFTFRKRKHFFGYMIPHYDSVQEGFRFDGMDNFVDGFQEFLKNLKSLKVPPPPPTE